MLFRFKMAAKEPFFISRHFDFGKNLKKTKQNKTKNLSQTNFSINFGLC